MNGSRKIRWRISLAVKDKGQGQLKTQMPSNFARILRQFELLTSFVEMFQKEIAVVEHNKLMYKDDKPLSKRRRVRKKKLKLTMNEDSLAEPLPQTVPPSSGAISLSESGPSFSIDKPLPQAVPPSKPLPQAVPLSKPLPQAVPTSKLLPQAVPTSKPLPQAVPPSKPLPQAVPPFNPLPKVVVPPSKPLPEAVPLSSAAKSLPTAVPPFKPLPEVVPPSKAVPPSSVTKLIPEAVQQSLRSGSQGEVLVNAYGIALTRQDLLTISNSGWLNDKVCYPFQCKFITFILQYRPSTYT